VPRAPDAERGVQGGCDGDVQQADPLLRQSHCRLVSPYRRIDAASMEYTSFTSVSQLCQCLLTQQLAVLVCHTIMTRRAGLSLSFSCNTIQLKICDVEAETTTAGITISARASQAEVGKASSRSNGHRPMVRQSVRHLSSCVGVQCGERCHVHAPWTRRRHRRGKQQDKLECRIRVGNGLMPHQGTRTFKHPIGRDMTA
jgi:hypothetical protein